MSQPSNPYESPHAPQHAPPPAHGEGDATGGLIPYKNAPALISYYLGLLSLLSCVGIGIVFSVPALVLGIIGLRKRAQNPAIKGSVHAWIGIVMGGVFTVIGALFIAGMITAIFAARSK